METGTNKICFLTKGYSMTLANKLPNTNIKSGWLRYHKSAKNPKRKGAQAKDTIKPGNKWSKYKWAHEMAQDQWSFASSSRSPNFLCFPSEWASLYSRAQANTKVSRDRPDSSGPPFTKDRALQFFFWDSLFSLAPKNSRGGLPPTKQALGELDFENVKIQIAWIV